MSAANLEPEELDAIREAIQQAQAPSPQRAAVDHQAAPIALIADDRAAERGRPAGLKIAARWARLVEKQLARASGIRHAVTVAGVETIDGAAMRAETADGWFARIAGNGGDGIVAITGALIESIAARLLGDRGAAPRGDRPPTPVARRLFGPVGTAITTSLVEAWRDELGSTLATPDGGDAWRHDVADADLVVVVTLAIAQPAASIRLIARPELLATATAQPGAMAAPLATIETLGEVPVEVEVELGRARLTMAELMALAPGAVVTLDRVVDEPLPVSCGGVVKARALPLASRGAIAIEIVAPVRTEKKP